MAYAYDITVNLTVKTVFYTHVSEKARKFIRELSGFFSSICNKSSSFKA